MVRGTGEGLSVGAPFGWREWPMGLMVVRGRCGAREKVSWCFGWRGGKGEEKRERSQRGRISIKLVRRESAIRERDDTKKWTEMSAMQWWRSGE